MRQLTLLSVTVLLTVWLLAQGCSSQAQRPNGNLPTVEKTKENIAVARPTLQTREADSSKHININQLAIANGDEVFPRQELRVNLDGLGEPEIVLLDSSPNGPALRAVQVFTVDSQTKQQLSIFNKDYLPCGSLEIGTLNLWHDNRRQLVVYQGCGHSMISLDATVYELTSGGEFIPIFSAQDGNTFTLVIEDVLYIGEMVPGGLVKRLVANENSFNFEEVEVRFPQNKHVISYWEDGEGIMQISQSRIRAHVGDPISLVLDPDLNKVPMCLGDLYSQAFAPNGSLLPTLVNGTVIANNEGIAYLGVSCSRQLEATLEIVISK